MDGGKRLVAMFEVEKQTTNTYRFQEIEEDTPGMIGALYLRKFAVKKLGNPTKIRVTVEAVEE